MKFKKSLITTSILATILSACGSGAPSGSSGNNPNVQPGAIVPPQLSVSLQSHGTSAYISSTDTMYYAAFLVTNKSPKEVTLSSVGIAGADINEFAIESDNALYPAGKSQCISDAKLTANASCEILVKLVNPNSITSTKKSAKLEIIAGGMRYLPTLSKTSYAYVAGDFSQVYANASESVAALTQIADANSNCGAGNYKCQLLEFNLANHNLTSTMTSDLPVNGLAVANNGIIYAGGGLTQANSGVATISKPGVGSLLVGINPALSGSAGVITDVLAANGFTTTQQYPTDQIYTLAYNNNRLYIAGGFQSMAGVGDGVTGYPIVTYDTTKIGTSNWTNAFTADANNANLAISALGFVNNEMYVSGLYNTLDGQAYLSEEETTAGNFAINSCTSSDNGLSFTCDASAYANLDSTVNADANATPQPASSLNFSPDGTLYAAGGFSAINGVGAGNGNYMIATLAPLASLSDTWTSLLNSSFPDNVIGTTSPYDNNKYYAGGFFSSIGGIAPDGNPGNCGAGALSFSGTSSCLLAEYDGTKFNKIFTTDGWINSVVFSSKIGS